MDAIFKRRSVRKYTEKPVEKEKIEKLLRAAMQAPTSGNQRPWEFLVVENKETLRQLSLTNPYSKLIANAPLAIVMLGNADFIKYPEHWEQDLAAATQNLLLEAVELSLGAVWVGVAPLPDDMAHIKSIFNFPDNIKPFAVVAIGYPDEEKKPVDRFEENRIHYENY
jgi:nitroreductase